MRRLVIVLSLLLGLSAPVGAELARADYTARTAARLSDISDDPVALRAFLQRFPKGADLHSHLSGAVYAESFVEWAIVDGLCLVLVRWTAAPPPCDAVEGRPKLSDALDQRLISRDDLINAWSMRGFVPGQATGHSQFFGSFERFGPANDGRTAEMLAEVAARAGAQNIRYLELMVSYGMSAARQLGSDVGWTADPDEMHRRLVEAELENVVGPLRREIMRDFNRMHRLLACGSAAPDSGCEVEVRILAQVNRNVAAEQLFAQVALAHALVLAEPLVVGFNLVAAEDNPTTLNGYRQQMETLAAMARLRPGAPLTLHAGELTLGLVPPRHLRDHIRLAVEVAGASRIGHGVALAYDRDPVQLLGRMAQDGIMVEINLTSNAQILGVSGKEHPFLSYLNAGVPIALSTDDEGVSRIDLTHEYQRAVATYRLDYLTLKRLSRNGLTYAFLPGRSLWEEPAEARPVDECAADPIGAAEPSAGCNAFLDANEKARLQWALESDFIEFERIQASFYTAPGHGTAATVR